MHAAVVGQLHGVASTLHARRVAGGNVVGAVLDELDQHGIETTTCDHPEQLSVAVR